MPPKADPYATKSAWTIDFALILFAVAMIVMVVCTAPRFRREAAPAAPEVAPTLATDTSSSARLQFAVSHPSEP